MPRLNARGQAVCGVGSYPASIDGRQVAPMGSCASWLSDDEIIYGREDSARTWTEVLRLGNGEVREVAPYAPNNLAAAGGRWCAWRSGVGLYGDETGTELGTSPTATDGRGAAAPDGTLAVCLDRQGDGPIELWHPDGRSLQLPNVYGLQVLAFGQALWNAQGGGLGSVGLPQLVTLPAAQWARAAWLGSVLWLVYPVDGLGLVAHPNGALDQARILPGSATNYDHDVAAVDGRLVVAYSTTPGERPQDLVRVENVLDLPIVDLTPKAAPIITIGRPVDFGFFVFGLGPMDAPGNCTMRVVKDSTAPLVIVRNDGTRLASYVAGASDSDVDQLDAAIAARKQSLPELPVFAYWTHQAQLVRGPRGADLVGVEAYRGVNESVAQFEARLRDAVSRVPAAWLIPQCYGSNTNNTPDLASIPPVIARVVRDCPSVRGVLVFSAGDRATGWSDHPEVQPLWREVFAGVTGVPAIDVPQEEFVDPFKVDVRSYGKTIERGQDYHAFVAIGNGIEIEVQKDAHDSLHFAVYKDGKLVDRSGLERHIEVKG